MTTQDLEKRAAAEAAVAEVQSGMCIGLGTGSTVKYVVEAVARRVKAGELIHLRGVATSLATQRYARSLGLTLQELPSASLLDLTIDGADEIDPAMDLIKGAGGALLREKMVAEVSRRFLIVADCSKDSKQLGTLAPIPVEVVPFGWQVLEQYLSSLGAVVKLRRLEDGSPQLTDQGNYLIDCRFTEIIDKATLARQLRARAGLVEHGLFLGLATEVFLAEGTNVRHRLKSTL